MKTSSGVLAVALFSLTLGALAADVKHVQGDKHQPKYGGVVQEVKEIQYELVAKPDSIALFIEDHGKKLDAKGGSAKVTLLNGRDKTEVNLAPAGENKLEAKGSFKVEPATKAVAIVNVPGKPAQSVRFSLAK